MKKNNSSKNWKKNHRFRKNKHGIRYVQLEIELNAKSRLALELYCAEHGVSRQKAIEIAIREKIEQDWNELVKGNSDESISSNNGNISAEV